MLYLLHAVILSLFLSVSLLFRYALRACCDDRVLSDFNSGTPSVVLHIHVSVVLGL